MFLKTQPFSSKIKKKKMKKSNEIIELLLDIGYMRILIK